MDIDEKKEAIALVYIKLTTSGEAKWASSTVPSALSEGVNDVFVECYETKKNNKKIYLIKRRVSSYHGEHDRYYSYEQVEIHVLDHLGRLIVSSLQPSELLSDLIEIVRDQAMDVENVLNDILGIDDEV